MSFFGREPAIITTAPLASVLARPRAKRSWLFEFFIAPFTDINHELAERMKAAAASRWLSRGVANAKPAV